MDQLSAAKSLLGKLIGFASVSAAPNRDIIEYIAGVLSDRGARVDILPDASGQKANLFATLGPDAHGGIVLSGHSDVVPVTGQDWQSDPFEMAEEEGRLYGRGSCDMKGFIACALAMLPTFAARPLTRPLHFAITHDEEVGCLGARALCAWLAEREHRPSVALIGEPTEMRVIEGHKGCCEYTVRFQGLAGHGSAPDLGVNAVEAAVRYVARLMDLADRLRARAPDGSPFSPPWTTINTGALVGGSAHNVIPQEARVDWECRPVQASDLALIKSEMTRMVDQELLPAMRQVHPEAAITTEVIGEVAGLEPASARQARDIALGLTGGNGADVVPFSTEAGLFAELGV